MVVAEKKLAGRTNALADIERERKMCTDVHVTSNRAFLPDDHDLEDRPTVSE